MKINFYYVYKEDTYMNNILKITAKIVGTLAVLIIVFFMGGFVGMDTGYNKCLEEMEPVIQEAAYYHGFYDYADKLTDNTVFGEYVFDALVVSYDESIEDIEEK